MHPRLAALGSGMDSHLALSKAAHFQLLHRLRPI